MPKNNISPPLPIAKFGRLHLKAKSQNEISEFARKLLEPVMGPLPLDPGDDIRNMYLQIANITSPQRSNAKLLYEKLHNSSLTEIRHHVKDNPPSLEEIICLILFSQRYLKYHRAKVNAGKRKDLDQRHAAKEFVIKKWDSWQAKDGSKSAFARAMKQLIKDKFDIIVEVDTISRNWLSKRKL